MKGFLSGTCIAIFRAMSSSKIKNKVKAVKVSRKKVTEIAPKIKAETVVAHIESSREEYKAEAKKSSVLLSTLQTFIGSSKKKVIDIASLASYRFEKWILLVLLALSTAAFLGVKLFESSDMSFTLTETQPTQVANNTLSNEDEFKAAFKENRKEAREIVEKHAHITHKIMSESKNKKQALAKNTSKKSSKKAVKNLRKTSQKKAIARR